MKKPSYYIFNLLFLIFFFMPFLCIGQKSDEAVVMGTIYFSKDLEKKSHKYFTDELFVFPPHNGYEFNKYIKKRIKVDSKGRFKAAVNLEMPTMLQLKISSKKIYIFVKPMSILELNINVGRLGEIDVSFHGDLSTENKNFQQLYWKREPLKEITDFLIMNKDTMDTRRCLDSTFHLYRRFIKPLDELLVQKKIDSTFYKIAERNLADRALSVGLIYNYNRHNPEEKDSVFMRRRSLTDSITARKTKLDSIQLTVIHNFLLSDYQSKIAREQSVTNFGVYNLFGPYADSSILPSNFFEHIAFNAIMWQYEHSSSEFNFIKGAKLFMETFPKGSRTAFLKPLLKHYEENPVVYQTGNDLTDTSRTLCFFNMPNHKSLGLSKVKEQIKPFFQEIANGRFLLVDFWATWCHPCIEEFKYSPILYEELRSRNMQYVYASIDDRENRIKWEKYIINNDLKGCHLMLSQSLYNEFKENIQLKSIPRYILIDPKGNIIKKDLARPSSMKKLLAEIDEFHKSDTSQTFNHSDPDTIAENYHSER